MEVLCVVNLVVSLGRHVKSAWKYGVRSGGWVRGFWSVLVMVEVLSCERSDGVWIVSIALGNFCVSGKCESFVCEIVWNE